jgi:hypothetical protein
MPDWNGHMEEIRLDQSMAPWVYRISQLVDQGYNREEVYQHLGGLLPRENIDRIFDAQEKGEQEGPDGPTMTESTILFFIYWENMAGINPTTPDIQRAFGIEDPAEIEAHMQEIARKGLSYQEPP